MNAKQDCLFWSSVNRRKGFSKVVDSVKYDLQKWIISHPRVIQYPIAKDYITVMFDDGNVGVKTEPNQKVIIQVSVR